MKLSRTVPPAGPLVSLDDLKAHLRVDHEDDDALIAGLEAAALAHIDGVRGVLGRCIQPQSWRLEVEGQGCVRLPFPDVTAIEAVGIDSHGAEIPAEKAELHHDAIGAYALVTAPGAVGVAIDMQVQLPEDALPVVVAAVKLMVGFWYANRETAVTGTIATALPFAVTAMLAPLRAGWV